MAPESVAFIAEFITNPASGPENSIDLVCVFIADTVVPSVEMINVNDLLPKALVSAPIWTDENSKIVPIAKAKVASLVNNDPCNCLAYKRPWNIFQYFM